MIKKRKHKRKKIDVEKLKRRGLVIPVSAKGRKSLGKHYGGRKVKKGQNNNRKKQKQYNLEAIARNAKWYYENHTLMGIATRHERQAAEVIRNPSKYRKTETWR